MAAKKWKAEAFHRGHVPTIACFNRASVPMGVDFDDLIAALQVFVDEHVAPVWGTRAKLVKTRGFVRGCSLITMSRPTDTRSRRCS
jgi:hypothetical protein